METNDAQGEFFVVVIRKEEADTNGMIKTLSMGKESAIRLSYSSHPSNGATAQIGPWPRHLPPQCSFFSGQLPITTKQKSGNILLHHNFPFFLGFPADITFPYLD
jgi:hypothetical protein